MLKENEEILIGRWDSKYSGTSRNLFLLNVASENDILHNRLK